MNMFIYSYVVIYSHIYVYIHLWMYIYTYIYICIYIYIHKYTFLCIIGFVEQTSGDEGELPPSIPGSPRSTGWSAESNRYVLSANSHFFFFSI
jgi:hypothetical protein